MTATSSYLNLPLRSEDEVRANAIRELARAKIRAQLAWEVFCKRNSSAMDEDALIDREIEGKRLCRVLNDADYALFKATALNQSTNKEIQK